MYLAKVDLKIKENTDNEIANDQVIDIKFNKELKL